MSLSFPFPKKLRFLERKRQKRKQTERKQNKFIMNQQNSSNPFSHLTPLEIAYIAGFLDGDGTINAQIVKRKDYVLGFQIKVVITFFQSTKRHWFLQQLQKKLKCGVLRKTDQGMSELTINGIQLVKPFLEIVSKHLKLKKTQARLVLDICQKNKKKLPPKDFLILCKNADRVGELNDSKKRTVTSDVVQQHFETVGLLDSQQNVLLKNVSPVETESDSVFLE